MSVSYRRLSMSEREELSIQLALGANYRVIAHYLGRSPWCDCWWWA